MMHDVLSWVILVFILFGLGALVYIARIERQIARMTRAVAGLVYQEEEKTRAKINELLSRPNR